MKSLLSWFGVLPQQYIIHKSADVSDDAYLQRYHKKFSITTIGSSFSPELVEQIFHKKYGELPSQEFMLSVLNALIMTVKISDVRIGIRWNRAINAAGKADLSYYKPIIDACLRKRLHICLNVGPIKTFGWPEEHIPSALVPLMTSLHGKNRIITKDDSISEIALFYLNGLMSQLTYTYSSEELKLISVIQPENEPFNPFGVYKTIMDEAYLSENIAIIQRYLPHAKILINAAHVKQLPIVRNLMKSLVKQGIEPEKLIAGVNYYYNVPSSVHIPLLGPIDMVTVAKLLYVSSPERHIASFRRLGIQTEVTEAQFEQWGNSILTPGNSVHELKYLLARCVSHLTGTAESTIRLWGLERLAFRIVTQDMTDEHERMLRIIQSINAQTSN